MRCTLFACLVALNAGACSLEAPAPNVAMRVEWQTGESPEIPFGVDTIQIYRRIANEDWSSTTVTVERLPFVSSGGRYADVKLLKNLPTGRPIEIQVRGLDTNRFAQWIGAVGPVVFRRGERRYATLRMYPLGVGTELRFAEGGRRFLHTATPLPDGRVLIAGGFTAIEIGVPCPPQTPGAVACHRLIASRSAWVFTPSSGFLHEVGGMSEPRAGHSATASADGSVLISGGAQAALLALVPNGNTLEAVFLPGEDPAVPTASSTSELFIPEIPSEIDDVDGDGDPGRGAFLTPTALGEPQFLNETPRSTTRPVGALTFQTTSVLRNGGLLTAGGLSLDLDDGMSPSLIDTMDVLYPELPPL